MDDVKKYRFGDQSKEYRVSKDYLYWTPDGFQDWYEVFMDDGIYPRPQPFPLTLTSLDGTQTVSIIVYQRHTVDAFPLDFFGEARVEDWSRFAEISLKEAATERFIIPLY